MFYYKDKDRITPEYFSTKDRSIIYRVERNPSINFIKTVFLDDRIETPEELKKRYPVSDARMDKYTNEIKYISYPVIVDGILYNHKSECYILLSDEFPDLNYMYDRPFLPEAVFTWKSVFDSEHVIEQKDPIILSGFIGEAELGEHLDMVYYINIPNVKNDNIVYSTFKYNSTIFDNMVGNSVFDAYETLRIGRLQTTSTLNLDAFKELIPTDLFETMLDINVPSVAINMFRLNNDDTINVKDLTEMLSDGWISDDLFTFTITLNRGIYEFVTYCATYKSSIYSEDNLIRPVFKVNNSINKHITNENEGILIPVHYLTKGQISLDTHHDFIIYDNNKIRRTSDFVDLLKDNDVTYTSQFMDTLDVTEFRKFSF